MPDEGAYLAVFRDAAAIEYPEIDALEAACGAAVDRRALLDAAYSLACPIKANPPHWQHGRVIYALARSYCTWREDMSGIALDIGTAKGFSAVVIAWAFGAACRVVSVDLIEPTARVRRNSVSELTGLKTVPEFVAPFLRDSATISFVGGGSAAWLKTCRERIAFAFVDGKHTFDAVSTDARLVSQRQQSGDMMVFDDAQIPAVARAVREIKGYAVRYVSAVPRIYAVCTKV
jgi:predicted O-methyltransferase YrrM